MQISLSRDSDVPLRSQLAEQIVFLITTGQLRAGQQMPSVRALARRLKIHHNTVSGAYQDLVRRAWLTRKRGSKLVVGVRLAPKEAPPLNLDELINETIQRAKNMGYSLQMLAECARRRLLAQPPDHFLVVEEERGLRQIMCHEIRRALGWPVEGCSPGELAKNPASAVGAQVVALAHIAAGLKSLLRPDRPCIPIKYSEADGHLALIRGLNKPSVIAVISASESLLRTARSLLAPAVGRRHAFRDFLLDGTGQLDLQGIDVAFCDSSAISTIHARQKVQYQLISSGCLESLADMIDRGKRE